MSTTLEKFCVAAVPILRSAEDRAWIEQLTQKLRPALPPHFTLVFPTPKPERAELIDEVARRAGGWHGFDVVLRSAMAMPPLFRGDAWHAFLAPDEGFSALLKLRAALHAGRLHGLDRADLPFVPHLTVGRSAEPGPCRRLAKKLNSWGFEVRARVEEVAVLTLRLEAWEISARIPL